MKALILITFLIIAQGCISTSEVVSQSKDIFPTVSGSDLNGEDKTFPNCLEKENTIVIVAFKREQQVLCDGWYEPISTYMSANSDTAYFEIPTISKMNPFMRWFIYEGMKGGIKDPAMRSQVVTLHIDKEPFKKSLGITSEDTVHVYVLGPKGEIEGGVSGEWTSEKWQKIETFLK